MKFMYLIKYLQTTKVQFTSIGSDCYHIITIKALQKFTQVQYKIHIYTDYRIQCIIYSQ